MEIGGAAQLEDKSLSSRLEWAQASRLTVSTGVAEGHVRLEPQ